MESSLLSGWKHCLFVCLFRAVVRVDPWTGPGLHIEVNALLTQDMILKVSTVLGLRKWLDSIIGSLLVSSTFKVAIVWFSTNNFWLIVGQGSFGSWNRGVEWECATNQYLPNIAATQDPWTRNWAVFSNILGKYYIQYILKIAVSSKIIFSFQPNKLGQIYVNCRAEKSDFWKAV